MTAILLFFKSRKKRVGDLTTIGTNFMTTLVVDLNQHTGILTCEMYTAERSENYAWEQRDISVPYPAVD